VIRRGVALGLALALAFASTARANPSLVPRDALEQGRTAYERGDYGSAIDTIHPLLYPAIELATEDEVVQAHRLLALAYFFVNKPKDAEQEVTSLLALRPSYQLDPILDPPVAVRFFDDVRRRQSERLNTIRQRELEEAERTRRERERRDAAARAKAQRIYVDRVVERHSRLIAALGFGVSEALFGGASLAAFLAINFKYPTDPVTLHRVYPAGEYNTATALTTVQLAGGALFWATVLWGIIDAEVLFKPEVVRGERERLAPPPAGKLSIAPILGPSTAGIGVRGSF
jgi:hypothetical protein